MTEKAGKEFSGDGPAPRRSAVVKALFAKARVETGAEKYLSKDEAVQQLAAALRNAEGMDFRLKIARTDNVTLLEPAKFTVHSVSEDGLAVTLSFTQEEDGGQFTVPVFDLRALNGEEMVGIAAIEALEQSADTKAVV